MLPSLPSRRSMLALAAIGLLSGVAHARSPFDRAVQGSVLEGHDPVAYFKVGKPVPGEARFSTVWQGATWWFSSDDNRQAFVAEPERYAPQYGAYCAYAMSNGDFATGDPKRWKIVGDRLYLNNNLIAQELWKRDIPGHIGQADGHWPRKRDELQAMP